MDDVEINFLDLGDSKKLPVILIHGMALDQTMWTPQIPVLKKLYRVVTYDIRGHGLSDAGDGQYTYKMLADDLIRLMDYLDIDQAVLCGLSMGGAIALRAYDMYPHRIRALILSDARSEADSNETKYWRENSIESIKNKGLETFADEFVTKIFARESFRRHPEAVKLIRNTVLSSSPEAVCGVLLAQAARTDMKHVLSKITAPTLIMVGEHDDFTPISSSQMMHDEIVNSEFNIISKAGHMSNLENPEEFNHNLMEFLGKLDIQ